MATTIGVLNAILNLDSSKFHRGFTSANKSMGVFEKGAMRVKNLLAGLFAGFAVKSFIQSTVDAGDKIQKLSDRLGATTEALSEYKHVAQLSGVTFETLTMGWQRMTRRVAEAANGMGEAREALRELGLDAGRLARLSPEKQFEILADALAGVESQSDKVRLVMKLFDSEGVSLLQTMNNGAKGLQDMRREANELGLTLSRADADAMAKFNDSLTRMSAALQSIGITLAPLLTGPLESFSEWVIDTTKDVVFFGEALGKNFAKAIHGSADSVEYFGDKVDALYRALAIMAAEEQTSLFSFGFDEDFDEMLAQYVAAAKTYQQLLEDINKNKPKEPPVIIDSEDVSAINQYTYAFQEANGHIEEYNRLLEEAAKVAESTMQPHERLLNQYDLFNTLLDRNLITQDQYNIALKEAQDNYIAMTSEAEKVNSVTKDLGFTFASAFEDAIVEGGKLRDILKGLEQDIMRIITRQLVTQPLAEGITGIIGGMFPARAMGGPVSANQSYLVGEHGPEIFTPQHSGNVTPNNRIGGYTVVNNFTIQAPQGTVSRESQQQIAAQVGMATNRAMRRNG
jgi:hypothetical protein